MLLHSFTYIYLSPYKILSFLMAEIHLIHYIPSRKYSTDTRNTHNKHLKEGKNLEGVIKFSVQFMVVVGLFDNLHSGFRTNHVKSVNLILSQFPLILQPIHESGNIFLVN